jgi:molybdopterin-guanine dinucleotide biosynthesis protein A
VTRPAGIVLAGGASRRFGSDKLAAPLADGRSVLAHAVDALALVADPIVVVLAPGVAETDLGRPAIVARDREAFGGPLAGLAAGLDALAAGTDAPGGELAASVALVVGGDMPWLVPQVLSLLADGVERFDDIRALVLDHVPTAVLPMAVRVADARAAAHDLLAFDHRRLRALLEALGAGAVPLEVWLPLDPDARTLRDIDTPAALA